MKNNTHENDDRGSVETVISKLSMLQIAMCQPSVGE